MSYQTMLNIAIPVFLFSAAAFLLAALNKKPALKTGAVSLLAAGSACLLASIVLNWLASGHAPMSNTYETMVFMAFITGPAYMLFARTDRSGATGFGTAVVILVLLAGSSFADSTPRPLVPALKSNWLAVHVSLSFISYAAFAVGFVAGIIYLVKGNEELDVTVYKSVLFGMPFLTLGIATGAVWAQRAWGSYWSWDPKETWALITWLVYGAYLHLRLVHGWKGKRSAWLGVAGFCFVIFTYFGVNYLLPSLHSYK